MRRGYGLGDTPLQYLSNVQLALVPVPEPSSLAIAGLGILPLMVLRRMTRKRNPPNR
jgi:hypothetical protein